MMFREGRGCLGCQFIASLQIKFSTCILTELYSRTSRTSWHNLPLSAVTNAKKARNRMWVSALAPPGSAINYQFPLYKFSWLWLSIALRNRVGQTLCLWLRNPSVHQALTITLTHQSWEWMWIPALCFSENIIHMDEHCAKKLCEIDLICIIVLYCVWKSVLAWASLKALQNGLY